MDMNEQEDIYQGTSGWVLFLLMIILMAGLLLLSGYVFSMTAGLEAPFWILGIIGVGVTFVRGQFKWETPEQLKREAGNLKFHGIPFSLGIVLALGISGYRNHADALIVILCATFFGIVSFLIQVHNCKKLQKQLSNL